MNAVMCRNLRPLLWATIMLVVLLAACNSASDQSSEMSRHQIESLVRNELPVGATRDDVVMFLDKRKIEHSGHLPALSPDDIYAIYRNTAGGTPVVKSSIQLVFHFRDGKLYEYEIKEILTGP